MVLEIIQREIPTRGIGYLILRDCPEERLDEGLKKGMEKLKRAGAKTVWATSLPEGEPLHPGPVGVWRLTHVHDLVRMERPLSGLEKPGIKLNLRQVKRGAEEKLFIDLINRSFVEVPNAATQRPQDMRLPNHRYVLAYQGEQLVGAYELDLNEKPPELSALAILPELRRQGLGRALLRAALEGLRAPACALKVSTANPAAMALYESEGFAQTGLVSGWFEVV